MPIATSMAVAFVNRASLKRQAGMGYRPLRLGVASNRYELRRFLEESSATKNAISHLRGGVLPDES